MAADRSRASPTSGRKSIFYPQPQQIATGRYVGEGFDDARLDALFLAMPIAWKGTLAQYVGRLHRLYPAKRDVIVYDYVDEAVPLLKRMSEKRVRSYKGLGYSIDDAPINLIEVASEMPLTHA